MVVSSSVMKTVAALLAAAILLVSCGDASSDATTSPSSAPDVAPAVTDPPATTEPDGTATTTTTTTLAATTTTGAPTTVAPATTAGPITLAEATFTGLTGHRGEGRATLVRNPDGTDVIETFDTDIGSGPELVVYLVPGEDRRDLDGAVRVADLAAETGSHSYVVPSDLVPLDGTWTVLVWCETFTIEVANATLQL